MKKIIGLMLLIPFLLISTNVHSQSDNIFEITVDKPMKQVYSNMMASLDKSRFYLFYEMDIGKNLAFFADEWGDEYNQNELSGVRSIVFCNGWFLNRAGNKDQKILGLCPMHVSLIEKKGVTTALFVRPTITYNNSPAHDVVVEIEKEVIEMIKNGMR
ncbi:MAG: DUF302 domain-containing protein [Pseudomonadota bacterium]|nr:DUF302 domain-containing protein [Pseudomonadota bacterium]